jgi:hypothetical protein
MGRWLIDAGNDTKYSLQSCVPLTPLFHTCIKMGHGFRDG